ncbi:hypothetical protein COT30_03865 [Candidatus Micrarchaeota archaeon CG08_land_8_20_14_0_20_49_17]|nr:MAG: hypothetical protein AUJ13_00950 [Candidatus Micrarchaeota archaeon CG1_02_49_24]PIU09557.1 MAG: hypothetical protein COT30_03865 [Candidatus Micrarchaeota archaeon CG08_land_8_20_14_0_20_49_17]PIU82609.1 MAG: hypothetical protein COS70_00435 [Candidatus Micrarchaeota archaeon CG06_land_8_20_14_3_00_50_6]HII53548.1 DUF736 domain-containing protein [Candidatus Micrarchaeota archaeon]
MGDEEIKIEVVESSGGGLTGERNRPDFRVMQPDTDRDGNKILTEVGAMWQRTSKNGNSFYSLNIGKLRLLVFPNTNK